MLWRLLLLLGLLLSLAGCLQIPDICVPITGPCSSDSPRSPEPLVSEFLGAWVNENPQPGQIIRLEISRENDVNYVQSWQACSPTDCNLTRSTTNLAFEDGQRVLRTFGFRQDQDKGIYIMLTKVSEERIEASTETYFDFTSGSLDDPQFDTYFFVKQTSQ